MAALRILGVAALALTAGVVRAGDFNGDGVEDLVIGVPAEDWGGLVDAGIVQVIYGSAAGTVGLDALSPPAPIADQFFRQGALTAGCFALPDATEAGDRFGAATAVGDFNGDGYDDLAIGAPYEDLVDTLGVPRTDAGAVFVLYGRPTGLNCGCAPQMWTQDSAGVLDTVEDGDTFGAALAVGDFNCDGEDDLAIGVPGETRSAMPGAGAVHILYGTPGCGGLTATGRGVPRNQFFAQGLDGFPGAPGTFDFFGASLAAGNFNGAGADDLAIGVPFEDAVGANSGLVHIVYGTCGSTVGLSIAGPPSVASIVQTGGEGAEANDSFGASLAAGNFDGVGSVDLAVGAPKEDVGAIADAGAVTVFYGFPAPILVEYWTQNSPAVDGAAEAGDQFGYAMTSGDMDDNGADDLAIGVPSEAISTSTGDHANAGAVHVIYGVPGAGAGLDPTGPGCVPVDELWHQDSPAVNEVVEANDLFGWTLACGDFDGNRAADLAIAAIGESLATIRGAITTCGLVHVIYGVPAALRCDEGLDASPLITDDIPLDELWHQNSPGVEDTAEASDSFGRSLAPL